MIIENLPIIIMEEEDYGATFSNNYNWTILQNENETTPTSHILPTEDNLGSNHHDYWLRYSLQWTILLILAYSIIFIVGTVGNVLVVCVLLLRPKMKTVTNLFILNLAIADILVVIFCVGPTLLSSILIPWVLGPFMCKAVAYVQGVSVCASVYSLVAVSLDRFLVIWYDKPRGLSKFQARIIIVFIWTAASIIISPWLFVFTLQENKEDADPNHTFTYCVESWSSDIHGKVYFVIGNFILCYTLPLLVIVISNGLTWLRVARRKVPSEAASLSMATIKKLHRKARHGVLRMMTILTLTFILSWMPLYILFLISKLGGSLALPEALENLIPFAQWLGLSNSSVNPILYAFLNKKFREGCKVLMTGKNDSRRLKKINITTNNMMRMRRANNNGMTTTTPPPGEEEGGGSPTSMSASVSLTNNYENSCNNTHQQQHYRQQTLVSLKGRRNLRSTVFGYPVIHRV